MRHRQPVDLRLVLIVYNFAMVGLSAYMFHEVRVEHSNGGEVACPWGYLFDCLAVPGGILALQLQLPVPACGLQHRPSGHEGKQGLWYLPVQACVLQRDLSPPLFPSDGPSLLVVLLQQDH